MVPERASGRRRDRHGRGLRGPLVPPTLPGWRTNRERFDEYVTRHVRAFTRLYPRLADVEFAVEEVPPSAPGRYEPRAVTLGRTFASDRAYGLRYRVVLYRLPIATRCTSPDEVDELAGYVLAEQCAGIVGCSPTDLDPNFPL